MFKVSWGAGLHTGMHTQTHSKATLLGLYLFTFTSQAALSCVAFAVMVLDKCVLDIK